jgi:hypothetical protein
MNANDINDLIIEAFLRKIDLPNVESWVRDQVNDQSIVLSEVKCVEVVLNWIASNGFGAYESEAESPF